MGIFDRLKSAADAAADAVSDAVSGQSGSSSNSGRANDGGVPGPTPDSDDPSASNTDSGGRSPRSGFGPSGGQPDESSTGDDGSNYGDTLTSGASGKSFQEAEQSDDPTAGTDIAQEDPGRPSSGGQSDESSTGDDGSNYGDTLTSGASGKSFQEAEQSDDPTAGTDIAQKDAGSPSPSASTSASSEPERPAPPGTVDSPHSQQARERAVNEWAREQGFEEYSVSREAEGGYVVDPVEGPKRRVAFTDSAEQGFQSEERARRRRRARSSKSESSSNSSTRRRPTRRRRTRRPDEDLGDWNWSTLLGGSGDDATEQAVRNAARGYSGAAEEIATSSTTTGILGVDNQVAMLASTGLDAAGFEDTASTVRTAGQNLENFERGAIEGGIQLANLPSYALTGMEAAEYGSYAMSETAEGNGGEVASQTAARASELATASYEQFKQSPSEMSGQLAGSTAAGIGAIGVAGRVSSTAAKATATAVDPTEVAARGVARRVGTPDADTVRSAGARARELMFPKGTSRGQMDLGQIGRGQSDSSDMSDDTVTISADDLRDAAESRSTDPSTTRRSAELPDRPAYERRRVDRLRREPDSRQPSKREQRETEKVRRAAERAKNRMDEAQRREAVLDDNGPSGSPLLDRIPVADASMEDAISRLEEAANRQIPVQDQPADIGQPVDTVQPPVEVTGPTVDTPADIREIQSPMTVQTPTTATTTRSVADTNVMQQVRSMTTRAETTRSVTDPRKRRPAPSKRTDDDRLPPGWTPFDTQFVNPVASITEVLGGGMMVANRKNTRSK